LTRRVKPDNLFHYLKKSKRIKIGREPEGELGAARLGARKQEGGVSPIYRHGELRAPAGIGRDRAALQHG